MLLTGRTGPPGRRARPGARPAARDRRRGLIDLERRVPVPAAVRLAPLLPLLARFLFIAAPWAVVVTGRAVCLLAQRVPALVWLVRAVYRWKDARTAMRGTGSSATRALIRRTVSNER